MASDNEVILVEGVNTLKASKDYKDGLAILSGRKYSCPVVNELQSLLKGFVSKEENGSRAFKHPESHKYFDEVQRNINESYTTKSKCALNKKWKKD